MPRWVKNLHRALLLGDGGRWGAAATALAMVLLSISGLVLLVRRMGGWRHVAGRVRGTLAQRLHVLAGRVVLALHGDAECLEKRSGGVFYTAELASQYGVQDINGAQPPSPRAYFGAPPEFCPVVVE